ncbi:phage tail protein [Corallococcus exiguus]|uniref:phage tail protein n=1 Tax=Corallococcus exiguus TaxID=83462 RepID=UPI001471998C|nr:phage tail protein [Corallococcus exiguus]NNC17669.1 phage tail protein [Corallococcus exiguus]
MSDTTTQSIETATTIPAPLKNRLLAKNRKVIKTLDLDGDKVHLCRPTHGDRVKVLDAAKAAGEMGDDNKPASPSGSLRTLARVVACVLYDPQTGRPIFGNSDADLDALCSEAVWLEDVQKEVEAAFAPSMKDVRGNSEATPS